MEKQSRVGLLQFVESLSDCADHALNAPGAVLRPVFRHPNQVVEEEPVRVIRPLKDGADAGRIPGEPGGAPHPGA